MWGTLIYVLQYIFFTFLIVGFQNNCTKFEFSISAVLIKKWYIILDVLAINRYILHYYSKYIFLSLMNHCIKLVGCSLTFPNLVTNECVVYIMALCLPRKDVKAVSRWPPPPPRRCGNRLNHDKYVGTVIIMHSWQLFVHVLCQKKRAAKDQTSLVLNFSYIDSVFYSKTTKRILQSSFTTALFI